MTQPDHPPTSRPLARRQVLLGAAGAAAFAVPGLGLTRRVLASAPPSSRAESGAAAGTVAADPFPVEIEGQLGTITLDAIPERVVSVGSHRDTDAALAFGVVPLATPDLTGFFQGGLSPWVLRAIESLGADEPELLDGELPFERIAELDPDLILATDRPSLEDEYDLLSPIAPTLSYANGYNKDEWQLTTARIGAAFGQSETAAQLIADVEAAVEAARDANPSFAGKTFTFGPVTGDGVVNTINSTTDASAIFFAALGLELAPQVLDLPQASFPGRAEISLEQLELLDADVMLLTFNTDEAREALEANPLFQQIPAVQRGAYVPLDLSVAISMGFPSALSIPYGLEQVVPELQAVLGDESAREV